MLSALAAADNSERNRHSIAAPSRISRFDKAAQRSRKN